MAGRIAGSFHHHRVFMVRSSNDEDGGDSDKGDDGDDVGQQ